MSVEENDALKRMEIGIFSLCKSKMAHSHVHPSLGFFLIKNCLANCFHIRHL